MFTIPLEFGTISGTLDADGNIGIHDETVDDHDDDEGDDADPANCYDDEHDNDGGKMTTMTTTTW